MISLARNSRALPLLAIAIAVGMHPTRQGGMRLAAKFFCSAIFETWLENRVYDCSVPRTSTRLPPDKGAAIALVESRKAAWRSAKHAAQWLATLAAHVFAVIGAS